MMRAGTRVATAVLCASGAVLIPAGPAAARPAHVGIVVQFAPGRVSTACAPAGGSGLALLDDAGFRVVIGTAPPYAGFVFTINGTGTTRPDDTHYWSYWRSSGAGGWAYSGSGAGSTTPSAGSVEGWSYVDGASSAPRPPSYTYAALCAGADPTPARTSSRAYAPPPPHRRTASATPATQARPPAVSTSPQHTVGPARSRTPSRARTTHPTRAAPTTTAPPTSATPSASTNPSIAAPPAAVTPTASPVARESSGTSLPAWGTVLAIVVVLALGTVAWLRMRRAP
jgi:hypothetical protein